MAKCSRDPIRGRLVSEVLVSEVGLLAIVALPLGSGDSAKTLLMVAAPLLLDVSKIPLVQRFQPLFGNLLSSVLRDEHQEIGCIAALS